MRRHHYYLKLLTLVFGLFIHLNLQAFDLTKYNFSYLYNHEPVKVSHQIAQQDSLYKLILTFHLVKVLPTDSLESFGLFEQKNVQSGKEKRINPIRIIKQTAFVKHEIEIDFQANPESQYLVTQFNFLEKTYLYSVPINSALAFPLPNFVYRTNAQAMFYNGLSKGDSVWVESLDKSNTSYTSYLYPEVFAPSLAPMIVDQKPKSEKLAVSSLPPFQNGFTLNESQSLYFVQADTSTTQGVSMLCHEEYYPKTKEVEELIQPLLYICTGDEYEELNESENKKLTFNEFWLDHIPDKRKASETIKSYFRSVKFANALFSDYKKGWKTDRGMIYIVFGPPKIVTQKEQEEIWEYELFGGQLKFTFAKTANLFVQHHYTLVREKALNKQWFQAVQKWRTGDI